MATFILRVELHKKDSEKEIPEGEYDKLHTLLLEIKFFRIIKDSNTNKFYNLPPAEYQAIANMHIEKVHSIAMEAIARLNRPYSTLISQTNSVRWMNLKEVKKI